MTTKEDSRKYLISILREIEKRQKLGDGATRQPDEYYESGEIEKISAQLRGQRIPHDMCQLMASHALSGECSLVTRRDRQKYTLDSAIMGALCDALAEYFACGFLDEARLELPPSEHTFLKRILRNYLLEFLPFSPYLEWIFEAAPWLADIIVSVGSFVRDPKRESGTVDLQEIAKEVADYCRRCASQRMRAIQPEKYEDLSRYVDSIVGPTVNTAPPTEGSPLERVTYILKRQQTRCIARWVSSNEPLPQSTDVLNMGY